MKQCIVPGLTSIRRPRVGIGKTSGEAISLWANDGNLREATRVELPLDEARKLFTEGLEMCGEVVSTD